MTLLDDTRIAGQKTVADWKAMKVRLEGCTDPEIWKEAFRDFFKARLENRYFKPIEALGKMEQYEGEGFAIATLHCSLIEFLASALEGKSYRYRRNSDPPLGKHEYSNSRDMFVRFLRCRPPFNKMFANERTAEDFYAGVRCGLLHEARTKGMWKIRVCQSAVSAIDTKDKILYRNKMQDAFDQFMSRYENDLSIDDALQRAFIRKFNSLCEE